jgi:hypothetical protein
MDDQQDWDKQYKPMEAKQMLQDAGYMVPAPANHPLMPTVGRIVHFYHKDSDINPRAAIVTSIITHSEVSATINLSVFSGNGNSPVDVYRDVPAFMPGVKHDYEYWWQWPPR